MIKALGMMDNIFGTNKIKKTKVKLDLLTDIDLLFMVEKGIRGGIIMLFIDMGKLIIKTWKVKIKNLSVLTIGP